MRLKPRYNSGKPFSCSQTPFNPSRVQSHCTFTRKPTCKFFLTEYLKRAKSIRRSMAFLSSSSILATCSIFLNISTLLTSTTLLSAPFSLNNESAVTPKNCTISFTTKAENTVMPCSYLPMF